jgi:hypothetical protein
MVCQSMQYLVHKLAEALLPNIVFYARQIGPLVYFLGIGRCEGVNAFSFQDFSHKVATGLSQLPFSLPQTAFALPVPALARRYRIGSKDSDFGRYNAFRFCP